MSGDVQPRKRKDKKKKKDDLGIEEPRGTAAALGEGDIFMHSPNDHGPGGHWCAKVIFFSLLAVLVTLIGLIILENRGLSELEANSVESRYSGVLEGWLEEGHDGDHHDDHTLELNHHDEEEDDEDHGNDLEHDDEDHDDELEHDDDKDDVDELEDDDDADGENNDDHSEYSNEEDEYDNENQENDDKVDQDGNDDDKNYEDQDEIDEDGESREGAENNNNSDEQDLDTGEDEDGMDETNYRSYYLRDNNAYYNNDNDNDDSEEDHKKWDVNEDSAQNDDDYNEDAEGSQEINDDQSEQDQLHKNDENDVEDSKENYEEGQDNEDEEDHEDSDVEVEQIEREVFDNDDLSTEASLDTDDNESEEISNEATLVDEGDEDEVEFLEPDDEELPEVMPIPIAKAKPLREVEDTPSTEKPQDTLADEEEYERQQEELRKQKEETSQGKDGGNSIEEWPGEPSDTYWRDELDNAEQDLRQGAWNAAAERASAAQLRSSARARYIVARALDSAAEAKRDNALLTKTIAAYLELLKMNERLSDKKLIEVTKRTLDRIKFRGNYLGAEPVYRLLIRRFPDDPIYRNNLTVSFLMANRVDLAEDVIKETLKLWPNDRLALAHYGFILKTLHNKLEEAVDAFTKALEGDAGPANEPRYYYHLGDSLLLLGRFKEAHEVHKRGATLGHFLSPSQRSLYNVERLKSEPWWDVEKTPYSRLARALEKSWKEILKEGRAAQEIYEKEKEGLKERGEWSQLELFARGREVPNRCSRAPVTCSIVRSETAAVGCRRGQVKFSSMEAGTHVRPHVGPTNCRLRMHLGLSNTKDTYIRVDQETRQWQTGKVLMFDDSFEHEVWHNGSGTRLVLIVDVWHPGLTPAERAQLPAI